MSQTRSPTPSRQPLKPSPHLQLHNHHPITTTTMTSNTPTIIDLKTSFLRTQIQTLSQPLRPSSSPLPETEEDAPLRQRAIDDALLKLNAQLKKHNKLAYGPQAMRHVAEQIDRLYWNAGERTVVGDVGEEWAERGCDFRMYLFFLFQSSNQSINQSTNQFCTYNIKQSRVKANSYNVNQAKKT